MVSSFKFLCYTPAIYSVDTAQEVQETNLGLLANLARSILKCAKCERSRQYLVFLCAVFKSVEGFLLMEIFERKIIYTILDLTNYHLFTETEGNSVFCGPETPVVGKF